MLNVIQEHKRCNRFVIIPWRNTIPFQELIGSTEEKCGSFQGRYHFGVDLGIISGLGSCSSRDHFGGCTDP